MKCWKCEQTVKLKKDGRISRHNVHWGYRSHLNSPEICGYSDREGHIFINNEGTEYLQVNQINISGAQRNIGSIGVNKHQVNNG